MGEHDVHAEQAQGEPIAGSSGWWGKFVALIAGAPPFAVWADEQGDDEDDDRSSDARR